MRNILILFLLMTLIVTGCSGKTANPSQKLEPVDESVVQIWVPAANGQPPSSTNP